MAVLFRLLRVGLRDCRVGRYHVNVPDYKFTSFAQTPVLSGCTPASMAPPRHTASGDSIDTQLPAR